MSKFKPGDRVSVVGALCAQAGGTVKYVAKGIKGTVVEATYQGLVIDLDEDLFKDQYVTPSKRIDAVHPRQCRRLLTKTRELTNSDMVVLLFLTLMTLFGILGLLRAVNP